MKAEADVDRIDRADQERGAEAGNADGEDVLRAAGDRRLALGAVPGPADHDVEGGCGDGVAFRQRQALFQPRLLDAVHGLGSRHRRHGRPLVALLCNADGVSERIGRRHPEGAALGTLELGHAVELRRRGLEQGLLGGGADLRAERGRIVGHGPAGRFEPQAVGEDRHSPPPASWSCRPNSLASARSPSASPPSWAQVMIRGLPSGRRIASSL
jgi:hypothetical protein